MSFADLHTHTIFSDGTSTPEELVSRAVSCGLRAIAITDHDSVEAVGPAMTAAKGTPLEVIPAIELSTEHEGIEVHILGFFVDCASKIFLDKLTFLKVNRVARVHKTVEKLKDLGLKLDAKTVFDIAGIGVVGRLHIARAMVKEGLVGSTSEAFARYIGDSCPGYVCGFKLTPLEAIKLIKDAGGVPVLAHPYLIKRDELITEFINDGIMGIEANYPEHSQSMINFYSDIARRNGLIITGGSDYHGNAKDVKLGTSSVPYEVVEQLKKARA